MSLFKKIAVMIIITLVAFSMYSQEDADENATFTTQNVMIKTYYNTNKGVIVEYFLNGKIQNAYLPNEFFENGIAQEVVERDPKITPQMNIVYKNGEQYKVKIYLPPILEGPTYQALDYVTAKMQEGFDKSKDTLAIPLWEDESSSTPE